MLLFRHLLSDKSMTNNSAYAKNTEFRRLSVFTYSVLLLYFIIEHLVVLYFNNGTFQKVGTKSIRLDIVVISQRSAVW